MSTTVGHSQYTTGREASYGIWHNCPAEQLLLGRRNGVFVRDDFTSFSADATIYDMQGDTAAVAQASDVGEVFMNCTAVDNNESYLAYGINLTGCAKMSTGGIARVWYETRLKLSAISDQGAFAVLALPGYMAADTMVNDTMAMKTGSGSYVGFRIEQTDSNGWDAVYATAGTAQTVALEAEATAAKYTPGASTYLQNAVADTWVKLGLYSDGTRCYWYVNGIRVDDAGVALSATNFPDGINLTPMWGVKTGEGVAKAMTIDWWQLAYAIDN